MLCTIPKKVLKKFEDVTPRSFPFLFRKTCFYAIWTDTQLWSEGSYELGFVHLAFCFSVLPSFCPVVFLRLAHLFFSGTQHGVKGPCSVAHHSWVFKEKKNCCPQNGGNGFFNLLENLVIFF